MIKTVTIGIGNSDNKLTQEEWHGFIERMRGLFGGSIKVMFEGFTEPASPKQSAGWVIQIAESAVSGFKARVMWVRAEYRQDSVAFTVGDTEFI